LDNRQTEIQTVGFDVRFHVRMISGDDVTQTKVY